MLAHALTAAVRRRRIQHCSRWCGTHPQTMSRHHHHEASAETLGARPPRGQYGSTSGKTGTHCTFLLTSRISSAIALCSENFSRPAVEDHVSQIARAGAWVLPVIAARPADPEERALPHDRKLRCAASVSRVAASHLGLVPSTTSRPAPFAQWCHRSPSALSLPPPPLSPLVTMVVRRDRQSRVQPWHAT